MILGWRRFTSLGFSAQAVGQAFEKLLVGEVRLVSNLLRRIFGFLGVRSFLLSLIQEVVDFLEFKLDVISNGLLGHSRCQPCLLAPFDSVIELFLDLLHRLAVLLGFS
ncbi:hypothetical protein A5761_19210 [Mycolicibacterium setense]|nr:hypothetical protein A5761_19210 [Mycolicibacterium setense]